LDKKQQVEEFDPCTKCGLYETKNGFCPSNPLMEGRGYSGQGGIMVIGQNPGEVEDQYNKVFIGASGKLLMQLFSNAEFPASKVWLTNAVKCHTQDNVEPETKHVNQCRMILEKEIEQHNPSLIVALGATALKSSTKKAGITKLRGTILKGLKDVPVVPTYHPAYVLRYPQHENTLISDLRLAKKVFNGEVTTRLPEYRYLLGEEDLNDFVGYLFDQPQGYTMVDIETNSLDPWSAEAKILSIGFCNEEETGWAVPLHHENYNNEEFTQKVCLIISGWLEHKDYNKGFHNLKFDVQFLNQKLLPKRTTKVCSVTRDSLLLHYLAVSEEESHSLKTIALKLTDMGDYDKPVSDFFEGKPSTQRNYEDLPLDVLLMYNAADCDAAFRIEKRMQDNLQEWDLQKTYDFLIELAMDLVDIEANGVRIDLKVCEEYTKEMSGKQKEIEDELLGMKAVQNAQIKRALDKKKAGQPCPVWTFGSTQALRILYFNILKKPVIKHTKKKEPSLDAEALGKYSSKGCVISQKILELRKVSKELSMYGLKAVKGWIHDDGLVHPQFLVSSTVTGRLSSKSPNYQNFPKGGKSKTMIVPRLSKDDFYMEVDYSQNELRGLAHYSGSPTLKKSFIDGVDVHLEGARQMFDYTKEEWETLAEEDPQKRKDLRQFYKSVAFGIVYGKGPGALAEDLWKAAGSPACGAEKYEQEAREKLDLFFHKEPEVRKWIDNTHEKIRKKKFIRSRFGRIRRLDAVDSESEATQGEALRQGVNFILQSWSADVTVIACMRFNRLVKELGWEVWLQGTVHDSINCDGHKRHLIDAACSLRYIMQRPPRPLKVPVAPRVSVGHSWGEAEEMDEEAMELTYEAWIQDCTYLELLEEITKDTWGPAKKGT